MNPYAINFSSPTLKFSVSGLRGLYPSDLNLYNMLPMLQAFSFTVGTGDIAVARDTRKSGEAVYHLVSAVLTACGHNVHHLGILPTPTLKAYVNEKKLSGGIMVSASHNPIQYNAFKFIKQQGFFFGQEENLLWKSHVESLLEADVFDWKESLQVGRVLPHCQRKAQNLHIERVINSVFPEDFLQAHSQALASLKVAIDPVGACASKIIPVLLEKLGIAYVAVNADFSDTFPRKAEPTTDALQQLTHLVKEEKCDIGFAFDPDADRLALVDENGNVAGEEYTLVLALWQVLQERQGNCVVNLSSSWLNRYVCEKNNSNIFLSEVGEANVVKEMLQKKAVFGGEGNGGIIDPEVPSLGRDSLSGVAWILRLLLAQKKSLSSLLQELPSVVMSKRTLKLEEETDANANDLKSLAQKIEKSGFFADGILDRRDGYHFSAKNGLPWLHMRASNTEPIVRLIAEAATGEELDKIFSLLDN